MNTAHQPLPPPKFSRRREWASQQAIAYLMQQAVENPDVISLAAGLIDEQTLPVAESRQAFEKLFGDERRARQVLQYGTTPGADYPRQQVARYLKTLEGDSAGVDPDRIILTTGSQQLLSLVAEVLLDPGDICLVAAPTYFVYMGALHGVGARVVTVPADADGLRTADLETALQQIESQGELDRVKMIYVVSYYDNPTGISLSEQRRGELVDVARRWSKQQRIFVVDDAAYRELRYDGPVLPSIWSFDETQETVVLAQSFSKSFSPGLRVGYGIVPEELAGPICDCKGNQDFGSANLNQQIIATVIDLGLYGPHIDLLRRSYRKKRDCMLEAADRYFSQFDGVEWVHPHGGLYVWMTLPETVNTDFDSPLFQRAAKVDKVMYVPGSLFYPGRPQDRPTNHIRLSFGVQTLEGIGSGMQRLSESLKHVM